MKDRFAFFTLIFGLSSINALAEAPSLASSFNANQRAGTVRYPQISSLKDLGAGPEVGDSYNKNLPRVYAVKMPKVFSQFPSTGVVQRTGVMQALPEDAQKNGSFKPSHQRRSIDDEIWAQYVKTHLAQPSAHEAAVRGLQINKVGMPHIGLGLGQETNLVNAQKLGPRVVQASKVANPETKMVAEVIRQRPGALPISTPTQKQR